MKIAGLVRSSTVDFPGMLSAVIFTPGCNLDCFFCHNRLLLGPDAPEMDLAEVLEFLERRRHLLDGVVFSGGEPTLQPDLPDMIARVRHLGYKTKLDTNGARPDVLSSLLENRLLDYVAIDCKAPWSRYPEMGGCSPALTDRIRSAFELLAGHASAHPDMGWEIRTTVVPQLSAADLQTMAGAVPPAPHYYLQRYNRPVNHRPEDRFRLDAPGYSPSQMIHLADIMRPWQPNVLVRA